MKIPVTKHRVKVHMTYYWWVYLLLAGCIFFASNLLYTTTRYLPPPEKKIDWYYQGIVAGEVETRTLALMQEINEELQLGAEETTIVSVGLDETYGVAQLTVWIAAGEGDLYQLDKETFQSYANGGAFLNLQPYIDSGVLDPRGQTLFYATDEETHERYPAGICTDGMTGLHEYGILSDKMAMGVLASSGNDLNTVKFLNALIERTQTPETAETVAP